MVAAASIARMCLMGKGILEMASQPLSASADKACSAATGISAARPLRAVAADCSFLGLGSFREPAPGAWGRERPVLDEQGSACLQGFQRLGGGARRVFIEKPAVNRVATICEPGVRRHPSQKDFVHPPRILFKVSVVDG
jgi:hypothetical protein